MKRPQSNRRYIRWILITIFGLTVLTCIGLSRQQTAITGSSSEPAFPKSPTSPQPTQTLSPTANSSSRSPSLPGIQRDNLPNNPTKTKFGHFPYSEDDQNRLASVGRFVRGTYERSEFLDTEAEQAFRQMMAAASAQGISLMPISGFRNVADQSELFKKQVKRRGSEMEAARASAPPGYSEHHTGYALDIADRQHPDTDLKIIFQETEAYRWLLGNAPKYGFEQSFPFNNKQGVNFEPWHWRYFGSPRSAQVFADARQSQP
jgi:zinc D-Ala-D-Ala carboxypeptidase